MPQAVDESIVDFADVEVMAGVTVRNPFVDRVREPIAGYAAIIARPEPQAPRPAASHPCGHPRLNSARLPGGAPRGARS